MTAAAALRGTPSRAGAARAWAPAGRPVPRWALLSVVLAIGVVDYLVPAGVVVGVLLTLPIILSSTRHSRRDVHLVAGTALVAFTAAAWLGRAPVGPPAFWVPNRVIASLSLPAAAVLALLLQRRRMDAERDRDAAASASELNRVLMSLLAHDLRAPLVVASQCIGYVEHGLAEGRAPDPALLAETGARLERSLRAIEIVLSVARTQVEAPDGAGQATRRVRLGDEIRREADSFTREAALRRKRLELRLDGTAAAECELNPLVLRQSLAILLDNAIRYGAPGTITISAKLDGGSVLVSVRDPGPDGASTDGSPSRGAGLGLALSRALLSHAGGELVQDGSGPGTCWTVRLPAVVAGQESPA